ncbi:MAG: hypothetical protein RBR98_00845 [Candidatus Moranbacteria bacterium]|jgi:hypothetical protein|nr:hypothetical protein [Candidatus Moranbacteria bacterium]
MNLFKIIFTKTFALITGYKFIIPDYSKGERVTIEIPGNLYSKRNDYTSYAHMLIEDFHNSIMPVLRINDNSKFEVRINPQNSEVEESIKEAISSDGRSLNLNDAVCDFVREATQQIFYYGSASYEIIQDEDGMELVRINPWSVVKISDSFFQIINRVIAKKIKIKPKVINLSGDKIFYVSMPKKLSSSKRLHRMLGRLVKISDPILPKFALESLELDEGIEFDQKQFWALREIQILRMTKKLGWNGRGISSDKLLEYYNIYKLLQFHKAKALIREAIFIELNRVFKNIYDIDMVISGLPTSNRIDELISKMKNGNIAFADIVNEVLPQNNA